MVHLRWLAALGLLAFFSALPLPARAGSFAEERAAAKAAEEKGDLLEARSHWRAAVGAAANTTKGEKDQVQAALAKTQEECIKHAKHQISEAEAYLESTNYEEAMKALTLALKYADQDSDREHQKAIELIKRIKRENER